MPIECRSTTYFIGDPDILSKTCNNRKVNGKQHTVTWHVDDLKSSHVDFRVNDSFAQWCEKTYGSDDLGHVKVVNGLEFSMKVGF
jgi:hypothetical protein